MLGLLADAALLVVGSSMGGWLALLLVRHLRAGAIHPLAGLVLIAPAYDMTERWSGTACRMR